MSLDPVTALLSIGEAALQRLWPDPNKRDTHLRKLEELAHQGKLAELEAEVKLLVGQMEVNKVEAASENIFKSGWRPFVGWCCGFSFVYVSIVDPFIRLMAQLNGYQGPFLEIDSTITMQVLFGMLGLGIMRSHDKLKVKQK